MGARLIEQAGFRTGFISGSSISATRLAMPDMDLVSLEKWRMQSRLASLQPKTFCGWPMAILATAMPAARPLPCLHRKPFAIGILYAAAWQFNYLFDDRISTEVEPLPSPPLRDGEWPPLTSNFTDLTIN